MSTLPRLVIPQLSRLCRCVCNVVDLKQDFDVEKVKPTPNESLQKQVKKVCLREMVDGRKSEKIALKVHQKWIRSIAPMMIQDLQPMNMPSYGMKHNASCPETRHTYLKVTSSLCKARLEESVKIGKD